MSGGDLCTSNSSFGASLRHSFPGQGIKKQLCVLKLVKGMRLTTTPVFGLEVCAVIGDVCVCLQLVYGNEESKSSILSRQNVISIPVCFESARLFWLPKFASRAHILMNPVNVSCAWPRSCPRVEQMLRRSFNRWWMQKRNFYRQVGLGLLLQSVSLKG